MQVSFSDNYNTWHKWWSYGKSGLRIVGCAGVMFGEIGLLGFAWFFLLAELIGIIEEWV